MDTVPEVECAHYPASFQELMRHNTDDPVIIATSHWGVWMRHDDASFPPRSCRVISSRFRQVIRVVQSAIQRGVIMDRGYGESVVGVRQAGHFPGLDSTRWEYGSSHGDTVERVDSTKPEGWLSSHGLIEV